MKLIALCLLSSFLFLASCSDKSTAPATVTASMFSLDSARAQISASNALYAASFTSNDSASFLDRYTTDACISPSNMEKMCGQPAIAMFFREGYKMGIRNVKLTTDEVMGGQEGIIETGKYEIQVDGGKTIDKGKFIVMWKEENGKWKMHRDIWNTDMPLPVR